MARYIKRWREINAEVQNFIQSSDSEDDQIQQLEANENVDSESIPFVNNYESDRDSIHGCEEGEDLYNDFGYMETIESSDSDTSDMFESDNNDMGACTSENIDTDPPPLSEELAKWANASHSTRASVNELLRILRAHGHEHLPKDARTLLQTPRHVESEEKCGGQYTYFGIENGLIRTLTDNKAVAEAITSIELNVNVDGVPLFRSSNVQLWPILCSFGRLNPFIVALFCGKSKPSSVTEFMSDFLRELIRITESDILHGSKKYKISIRSFICDAPARAFLKCI